MTLTTGQILQGRYRVVSPLSPGGMGAVYQAWDIRLNIHVALKEMAQQPGIAPHTLAQFRQQFKQEATVLALLSHPHLVRVTDFFDEQGNVYLVMDFVEGESLADLVERDGPQPEGQTLDWVAQVLDALGYCHDQGVIHRDVKPPNIIVQPNGRAVLVDFGLVKLQDPTHRGTATVVRGMGTPEYTPPEQYDRPGSGHTDARSDIYALGATLYHLVTGEAPATVTLRMASPGSFRRPRQINANISSQTESAILKAMEVSKAQRFQSVQEMLDALTGVDTVPSPATGTGQKQRTRFPVSVWAIVGLLILVVFGGLALARTDLFEPKATAVMATPSTGTLEAVPAISSPSPVPAAKLTRTATAGVATPTPVQPTPTSSPTRPRSTATPTATATKRATATPLPTAAPMVIVTGDRVNLREGPSTAYGVAGMVNKGTELDLVACVQDGSWWQVSYDGKLVWIAASLVESNRHMSQVPVVSVAPPPSPPLPVCNRSVGPRFEGIWSATQKSASAASRLGCPLNDAHATYGAAQEFQNGYMLWRSDNQRIYVLHTDKGASSHPDDFQDGRDPEKVGYSPPSGYQEPKRGFGKVWREHLGGPSARIGWARGGEYVAPNLVVQDFENGIIFWEDKVGNRLVLSSGHWAQR